MTTNWLSSRGKFWWRENIFCDIDKAAVHLSGTRYLWHLSPLSGCAVCSLLCVRYLRRKEKGRRKKDFCVPDWRFSDNCLKNKSGSSLFFWFSFAGNSKERLERRSVLLPPPPPFPPLPTSSPYPHPEFLLDLIKNSEKKN